MHTLNASSVQSVHCSSFQSSVCLAQRLTPDSTACWSMAASSSSVKTMFSRAPRLDSSCRSHALALAGVDEPTGLDPAVEHVVAGLVYQQRGAELPGDAGRFPGLGSRVRRDADVQRPAGSHRLVEGHHGLLDRRVGSSRNGARSCQPPSPHQHGEGVCQPVSRVRGSGWPRRNRAPTRRRAPRS